MMEFKKFKKFNYINASKKFGNDFHYICFYTVDIPTMGSHRDNMCFVFT